MRREWPLHVIGHFEIEHELFEIDLDDQRIQIEIGSELQCGPGIGCRPSVR